VVRTSKGGTAAASAALLLLLVLLCALIVSRSLIDHDFSYTTSFINHFHFYHDHDQGWLRLDLSHTLVALRCETSGSILVTQNKATDTLVRLSAR
jgi:hypothetical protein